MASAWRHVRVTDTHGIFREDTQHPETGAHYATHVTGFDEDGNPVRPVHTVPETAGVRSALNETRLEEVRDSEVEALAAQHAEAKRAARAARPSADAATTLTLTPEDFQARVAAAVIDAQAKGKNADPLAIAADHTQQVQDAQGLPSTSDAAPPAPAAQGDAPPPA